MLPSVIHILSICKLVLVAMEYIYLWCQYHIYYIIIWYYIWYIGNITLIVGSLVYINILLVDH